MSNNTRRHLLLAFKKKIEHTLIITGLTTIEAENAEYVALYDTSIVSTGAVWSIISGSQYASIDNTGFVTIETTADDVQVTIQCEYGGLTATQTLNLTYKTGSNSETETEVIVDPGSGEVTTTTTTTTTNEDGSTSTTTTIITNDSDGNPIGSSETEVDINADGSSSSTTTNYNADGDPESQINNTIDTDGNSSTQTIIYDDEGNETVTGYTIDTTENPDGEKTFNGDGVNTEYYAFDLTHGFVLDYNFTIDFAHQPAGQNENHHNILTMKRATPTPWYGFQLRQSGSNKYIQLGTQFSSGSNSNLQINPTILDGNVAEYNFKIIYDPTASTNKFRCIDMITGNTVMTKNDVFPDLPELKYLKVTLGYAMDENGNPYRYSNINVKNFSIKRLSHVVDPVITCDGRYITITCETVGATIYYRLNSAGHYVAYTSPIRIYSHTIVQSYAELDDEQSNTITQNCIYDNGIDEPVIVCENNEVSITCETVGATIYYRIGDSGNFTQYTLSFVIQADTVVYAYAELNGEYSDTVSENCIYDSGIKDPNIFCDGELITIDCDTPSVTIYYKLNNTGNFQIYEDAIEIFEDTFIEAYAELNGAVSHTISQNCVYSPIVMVNPQIMCNGSIVTITCATPDSTIYYKLNNSGNYVVYNGPISIYEDTVVEAYAKKFGHVSGVTTQTCIYNPVHDYSQDYLTFRVLSPGKIYWRANGGVTKSIDYSLNNSEWTTITSSDTPPTIDVVANDIVRFRGSNASYGQSKTEYSGFGHGQVGADGTSTYDADAAEFDIEGNIMSLIYGDNFAGQTSFNGGTYNFCSMFKKAKCVSAENLILPPTTLREACYRALFSWATYLETAPAIPATTLATYCCWYMFERTAITTAPDLLAETLVKQCYGGMFNYCTRLNYIKCTATSGFSTSQCLNAWVANVASSGTFVKDVDVQIASGSWTIGANGIPTNWLVYDNMAVASPEITYDGFDTITITCDTAQASIYYKLNNTGSYTQYTSPITISATTYIETYAEFGGQESRVVTQNCVYVSTVPLEASNRDLTDWVYNNQNITTPYSVNAIDGHSSSYAKGTFNFETTFTLREAQPAHLWFQHADHSASIYIDNTLVEKHWGGYTAFTVDISNFVHQGQNNLKVAIKNNEGNNLAPASGDFNFNATLGNVKLLTSPVLPDMSYGYDGFHVTSTVTDASATVNVKTLIPIGASVVCTITDGTFNYTDTMPSTGEEMTFTTVITNPHLWNGKQDPHLYNITLDIYYNNELYHTFTRGYGLRYYEYVINDIVKVGDANNPYTGFLLNGSPYLLRGVCMHDDIDGKANALNDADYNQTFSIIQELGCNFLRLAHYPHPKEVYDRCDQLGIIVQTEGPCVNKMQSTMPTQYYEHLTVQYTDMVNQHYNHPCIIFWGLSNETTTDDKAFAKEKIDGYTALIKNLDPERMVGYVLAQGTGSSPSAYYNDPAVDWFGCNIYVGWYDSPDSNTPTSQINTRLNNTINRVSKPMAYSEYGCGGTQHCHSDNFLMTTTRGNKERHDIEYMMWLHEGQIATIKQYPQLLFTSEWQLFDIAVSNRNEGYTVCLDGETTSTDDNLRRLNNKGLVERDHRTKKDTFYLYKAWWNPTPFVHICGKDYTKVTSRTIKCYSNDGSSLKLYVNNALLETVPLTDNIATFTAQTYGVGDIIRVDGDTTSDTFIIGF